MSRSFAASSQQIKGTIGTITSGTSQRVTMALWFKASSLPADARALASIYNSSGAAHYLMHWLRGDHTPKAPAFRGSGSASGEAEFGSAPSTGAWHCVVGTINGATGVMTVVLDSGTKVSATVSPDAVGINTCAIGAFNDSYYFDGLIAHVAIWDIVLADADQSSLASGTAPSSIQSANLIHYWPFTEDHGSTEPDHGTGNSTLTLTNSPTYSTDNPSVGGAAASSHGNLLLLGCG